MEHILGRSRGGICPAIRDRLRHLEIGEFEVLQFRGFGHGSVTVTVQGAHAAQCCLEGLDDFRLLRTFRQSQGECRTEARGRANDLAWNRIFPFPLHEFRAVNQGCLTRVLNLAVGREKKRSGGIEAHDDMGAVPRGMLRKKRLAEESETQFPKQILGGALP